LERRKEVGRGFKEKAGGFNLKIKSNSYANFYKSVLIVALV
jgi:hypothetical protein